MWNFPFKLIFWQTLFVKDMRLLVGWDVVKMILDNNQEETFVPTENEHYPPYTPSHPPQWVIHTHTHTLTHTHLNLSHTHTISLSFLSRRLFLYNILSNILSFRVRKCSWEKNWVLRSWYHNTNEKKTILKFKCDC